MQAFQKLGIMDQDIATAIKRMETFFDLELNGVRKMWGILIRELVSLTLAKEEKQKVIYTHFPPGPPDLFLAASMIAGDIYVGNPSELFSLVLGALFGKLGHVLDAAEGNGITPGDAHCGRHQVLIGLYALNLIPIPDLSLSWSWFCDEATKTDEFSHLLFNLPGRCMTIGRSIDNRTTETETSKRAFQYLTSEIRDAKGILENVIGKGIPDETIREAIKTKGRYWKTYFKIINLHATASSQPLNVGTLMYVWTMGNLSLSNHESAQDAIDTLYNELKARVAQGRGVVPPGSPRVMIPLTSLVDPGVTQLLEEQGIAIPILEVNLLTPKTYWPAPTDIYEEISAKFFKSPISQSFRMRIDSILEACKKNRIDGLFWYNHFSCRPTYTDSMMIIQEVKEKLDLPAILVEGDAYDPRYYTKECLRTRIEAFAEIMKTRKPHVTCE
jgi:hypothetical protein